MAFDKISIAETLRKYNLKENELSCILIYFASGVKSFAWTQTIGLNSRSNNSTVMSQQFFNQDRLKLVMYDFEQKFWNKESNTIKEKSVTEFDSEIIKQSRQTDQTKSKVIEKYGLIQDVTAENIKELFINELNNSDNPEKRADLLLKLSGMLELFTPEEQDLQTPTIYLPQRCKTCQHSRQ